MKHRTVVGARFRGAALFFGLAAALLMVGPVLAKNASGSVRPAAPSAPSSSQGASKAPDKALRIYLKTGEKKTYIRGYQWMVLDLNRKLNLVESARNGALRMNALMTLPAERYVDEVDRFFQYNPALMQMEVGQVIQGIAISLKDWEQEDTEN